jgi:hypothetical protein
MACMGTSLLNSKHNPIMQPHYRTFVLIKQEGISEVQT